MAMYQSDIPKLVQNMSKDFHDKISELQFQFDQQVNELILAINSKLNSPNEDSENFLTNHLSLYIGKN